MWKVVFKLELGLSQGRSPSDTLAQVLVPPIHQLRSRLVLYEPQTGNERRGPSSEERTGQADEFVTTEHLIAPRLTGTQGDEGPRKV